ncbi:MAG TPA: zinc ribbon domain-containing protein [Armatimonadota bacterium]|nr:zinc ribbon domain-containing protein [Armatimonadota bacterium]
MPLYEFRCRECQHTFEIRTATMAVPEELACPKCGSKQLRRLISNFFSHTAQKAPSAPSEACCHCGGGDNPQCPFRQ